MNRTVDRAWAEHVCHPVTLAAVLALVVNDHLLKGAGLLPSAVTGKLSDFAGLFFFPALLAALVRGALGLGRKGPVDLGHLAIVSVTATGVAFAALKLSPAFNSLVSSVWGANALDPTDLWALTALVPAWVWLRNPRPFPAWRGLEFAAVVVAGLASLATSYPRSYLRSHSEPGARTFGCAEFDEPSLQLFGGTAGIAEVVWKRLREPCVAEVLGAELRTARWQNEADEITRPLRPSADGVERLKLNFPYRANAPSSMDTKEVILVLDLRVEGRDEHWEIALSAR